MQEGIEYAEETESKMSLAKLYFTAGQLFLNNHVNKDIALEYLLEAKSLFEELNDLDYLNWVNLSIGMCTSKQEMIPWQCTFIKRLVKYSTRVIILQFPQ